MLPAGAAAYNLNGVIPASSWYGALLGGLLQFKVDPSWLQVIGWLAYASIVLVVFLRVSLRSSTVPTTEATSRAPEQLTPAHAGDRA